MRSVALVESPAQLLNVVEWSAQCGRADSGLTIIVLAPTDAVARRQLRCMAALAREEEHVVQWHEPRLGGAATARTVRSLATELSGVDRLIVGDPFSGVLQVVMSVTRAREVVVVDDGTATLEFVRQWQAGEHLSRWHSVATESHRRQIAAFARDQVSGSLRRRLSADSGTRLSLFSSLEVPAAGLPVVRNEFSWVRSRFAAPTMKAGSDLIGTSLVETGVVEPARYLAGVASLAEQFGVDRYFAHRRESPDKLAALARGGLEVVRPDLPLEIAARQGVLGQTMISFPSTVVHTLPQVLRDTPARLLVCDIAENWFTPAAPVRSETFLGQVTQGARHRFGLAAVAC